jgi:hypothetical protein
MESKAMGYDRGYMSFRTSSIRGALVAFCLLLAAGLASGCGYTLQNSKNSSLREIGVEKIYVRPVKNKTYKAGVENLFYNELIQIMLAGKRVKIVDRPEIADAILEGVVNQAGYAASVTTPASAIFPSTVSAIEITVATEYQASVSATFLLRRQTNGFPTSMIWSSSFSRARRFAGNNQKLEYGSTSALINESEFERALQEVAHGMMQDVHEAMLARF